MNIMKVLINSIKKLFNKNKIKYISAPSKTEERNISVSIKPKENKDSFRTNIMYQADPDISDGNGYKIKQIDIKDMV